jgi:hypothetical protein
VSWVIILPVVFIQAIVQSIVFPNDKPITDIQAVKFIAVWGVIDIALGVGIMIGWIFTGGVVGDTLGAVIGLGAVGLFWLTISAAVGLYEAGKRSGKRQ